MQTGNVENMMAGMRIESRCTNTLCPAWSLCAKLPTEAYPDAATAAVVSDIVKAYS